MKPLVQSHVKPMLIKMPYPALTLVILSIERLIFLFVIYSYFKAGVFVDKENDLIVKHNIE